MTAPTGFVQDVVPVFGNVCVSIKEKDAEVPLAPAGPVNDPPYSIQKLS
jgi:hypothetical protein